MQSVFRKAAIERLTSPDRLDSMLKVTTPLSWVGIAAAAALAAAVVFWALTGSIPATVSASGFLVNSYNTNTVYSNMAGTVNQIMVEPGSTVQTGDPILTGSRSRCIRTRPGLSPDCWRNLEVK